VWSRRPVHVVARLAEIAAAFGGWWLKVQLHKNESRAAADMREVRRGVRGCEVVGKLHCQVTLLALLLVTPPCLALVQNDTAAYATSCLPSYMCHCTHVNAAGKCPHRLPCLS
jgi:hypothetical protein